jgi:hypothetical protein
MFYNRKKQGNVSPIFSLIIFLITKFVAKIAHRKKKSLINTHV